MKIDDTILLDLRHLGRDLSEAAILAFYQTDTTHHDERVRKLMADLEAVATKLKEKNDALVTG